MVSAAMSSHHLVIRPDGSAGIDHTDCPLRAGLNVYACDVQDHLDRVGVADLIGPTDDGALPPGCYEVELQFQRAFIPAAGQRIYDAFLALVDHVEIEAVS
jgi:hypothetical protein